MSNVKLPELPRAHKAREANFALQFRDWWEHPACPIVCSASFELKQCEGESLPFAEVKASQVAYASQIASARGALVRVQGLSGEPDYIGLRGERAYIVVKYAGRGFVVIRAGAFVLEREASSRKSLTWERAQAIADIVVCNGKDPPRTPHAQK